MITTGARTTRPVLLTMPAYSGTLAAARCLGRAGIPVTIASDRAGMPAAWSRWTSRRVRCPDVLDSTRFLDWLCEFGSREPGHVLYPTCDDLAFLFARNSFELGRRFLLYQPPLKTMLTLLDKAALADAASRAGLDGPVTYVPESDGDLARIARRAAGALVIKPRTQVMFRTRSKGLRVQRSEDLADAYRAYTRANRYLPPLLTELPHLARPIVQEYHPEAESNVQSISGFIDETGELFVSRGSQKILQRPRRFGVGVCFEDVPLDPTQEREIAALCRETGYFGVFEAEFVKVGNRRLLIDFNPRYFNQMGFDIARGMPLPLLAYAGALSEKAWLERAVYEARSFTGRQTTVWCHRVLFGMFVVAEGLSRPASIGERPSLRAWYAQHRERTVDAVFDRDDMLPALTDVVLQLRSAVRHPRAFVRSIGPSD